LPFILSPNMSNGKVQASTKGNVHQALSSPSEFDDGVVSGDRPLIEQLNTLKLRSRRTLQNCHTGKSASLLTLTGNNDTVDLRGFLNLMIIVLVAMNIQLVLENLKKYGIMLKLPSSFTLESFMRELPCYTSTVACFASTQLAWLIELMSVRKMIAPGTSLALHIIYITLLFCVPGWIVWTIEIPSILASFVLVTVSVIMTLKMWSFAHYCYVLKTSKEYKDILKSEGIQTPNPHTHTRLIYFILAPTLCYQLSYPKSPSIRWKFAIRRLCEAIFCTLLSIGIIQQYVLITVLNTMPYFESMDYMRIFQRTLKLAVPNLIVWLIFFYGFFHGWLNFLGEVLKFEDREFYKAWWNSRDLGEYWRLWNMPVHRWAVRHLYTPLRKCGLERNACMVIVFAWSAFLHEFLISVPCRKISCYAFFGMFAQIPLIQLSNWLRDRGVRYVWGNCLFWTSFCILGQPMGILLYAYQLNS